MKGGYLLPNGFIVLRVGSALILFLLFHTLFIKEKIARKDLLPAAISALFGVAANMLMFFKGLSITTPINGAVLMLVTPVFVLLVTALFTRERVAWYKWLGLLMACLGALYLTGGRGLNFNSAYWVGDLFIIGNALSFAIYLVYVKKLMMKYHPVTVSKWNFIFGFLMVLPFGYGDLLHVSWGDFPAHIWLYIFFILVGTTFLTYLLNAWALGRASSTLVGSYIYLQPVITSTLSLFAQKDELSAEKIGFILLIFAGVYLVSLKKLSIAR